MLTLDLTPAGLVVKLAEAKHKRPPAAADDIDPRDGIDIPLDLSKLDLSKLDILELLMQTFCDEIEAQAKAQLRELIPAGWHFSLVVHDGLKVGDDGEIYISDVFSIDATFDADEARWAADENTAMEDRDD